MDKYEILTCTDEEAEYISDQLLAFNLDVVPPQKEPQFETIYKKIEDADGNIIAGCLGYATCWYTAYLDILWVTEAYRKQGLGTALIADFERELRQRECTIVYLDTFDWQAKDFYLKQGYELFGTLENYPKGHNKYFLKKDL